eukprot:1289088-Alexandrium_andersonii.AAC.1
MYDSVAVRTPEGKGARPHHAPRGPIRRGVCPSSPGAGEAGGAVSGFRTRTVSAPRRMAV